MKQLFTDKYKNNSWKGTESRSGPGSSLKNNIKLLEALPYIIRQYNINSILDAGCGDFNWLKHFDFNLIKSYLGVDIVDEAIQDNKKYETSNIQFKQMDIVNEPLNICFDLIICKDCLFHLSFKDALRALQSFKQSCSTYLLATTFIGYPNNDILTGNWHRIDMETEPFNMGKPVYLIENAENLPKTTNIEKSIGLWKIN